MRVIRLSALLVHAMERPDGERGMPSYVGYLNYGAPLC
jgi:hypothetical protein